MIDKPQINIPVFSKLVTLDIWRYSYADRLRPVVYLGTSVVIICFGIDDPDSLSSVQDLWVSEVRHLTGNAKPPILLVGCKMDIRTDPVELRRMRWNGGMEPVSMQQGREVAKSIGATMYLECSAKTGQGVDNVFHHAARLSLPTKAIS
ncbi:GTP-binding protein Rho1 [Serendipita sp. 411]|nr:GTP-binding protein Rho1 [Serendipita sp. 398]KAG8853328.1 GTP-binding protein Rho1 [Serendipita sp. 405]KAG8859420.1 GTP-binding protein Rho1 [Serendipita sp. 411]